MYIHPVPISAKTGKPMPKELEPIEAVKDRYRIRSKLYGSGKIRDIVVKHRFLNHHRYVQDDENWIEVSLFEYKTFEKAERYMNKLITRETKGTVIEEKVFE